MVGREGLGAYVGGLGPLLGPMLAVLGHMLAVLGRSWGLCWRAWAALGAHVRGLGSGSGPKLAVLGPMLAVLGEKWPKPERGGDLASGSGRRSGPNPSGKAVLGRGWKSSVFGRRDLLSIFFYTRTLDPEEERIFPYLFEVLSALTPDKVSFFYGPDSPM